MDSYIVAGIADHLTRGRTATAASALLGGDSRFVLASAGHIAALVNPPGNPKARYQVNENDPGQWLQTADSVPGSWWPDLVTWLGERCGADKAAPAELGGGGSRPLCDAPGTYVFDR